MIRIYLFLSKWFVGLILGLNTFERKCFEWSFFAEWNVSNESKSKYIKVRHIYIKEIQLNYIFKVKYLLNFIYSLQVPCGRNKQVMLTLC